MLNRRREWRCGILGQSICVCVFVHRSMSTCEHLQKGGEGLEGIVCRVADIIRESVCVSVHKGMADTWMYVEVAQLVCLYQSVCA